MEGGFKHKYAQMHDIQMQRHILLAFPRATNKSIAEQREDK